MAKDAQRAAAPGEQLGRLARHKRGGVKLRARKLHDGAAFERWKWCGLSQLLLLSSPGAALPMVCAAPHAHSVRLRADRQAVVAVGHRRAFEI